MLKSDFVFEKTNRALLFDYDLWVQGGVQK